MLRHMLVNVWLIVLTLFLCAVLYPAILLGVAQLGLSSHAEGSLVQGPDGKLLGSTLITQPFTSDKYFQPRPSAVAYNAAASGASNWAGSNYLLRERVSQQLGPIVTYRGPEKRDRLAGPDIEEWFSKDVYQGKPGIVAQWSAAHPGFAERWVKTEGTHADLVAAWMKRNPGTEGPPETLALPFFAAHAGKPRSTWPEGLGAQVQSVFFEAWRQDHPDVLLHAVPADRVMASASGLDPHITIPNANYQMERICAAWATETGLDLHTVRKEIGLLVSSRAAAPLAGLAGVPLVNVLDVNLALQKHFAARSAQAR